MDFLYNHRSYRSDTILMIVFIAMLVDYLLTYLGIKVLSFIQEANPLMYAFMELPFYKGIFFRILYGGFLLIVIRWAGSKLDNKTKYHKILMLLLIIQFIPFSIHAVWLVSYLSMHLH